uniref:Uncharacterized protein n=1 Tax=Helianthus annuus TaxID=4232 RepID=A0A251VCN1_HELAN
MTYLVGAEEIQRIEYVPSFPEPHLCIICDSHLGSPKSSPYQVLPPNSPFILFSLPYVFTLDLVQYADFLNYPKSHQFWSFQIGLPFFKSTGAIKTKCTVPNWI